MQMQKVALQMKKFTKKKNVKIKSTASKRYEIDTANGLLVVLKKKK